MSDGLDFKEVRVHTRSRSVLCPHCGVEGRNFFIRGSFHSDSVIPGSCKECGETFVIHFTEDPKREAPLRTLAMAIHQASRSWDNRNAGIVGEVKTYLSTVMAGIPGMHALSPEPVFLVHRNAKGNMEIVPKNNAALRTTEIWDEIRRRDLDIKPPVDVDEFQGI